MAIEVIKGASVAYIAWFCFNVPVRMLGAPSMQSAAKAGEEEDEILTRDPSLVRAARIGTVAFWRMFGFRRGRDAAKLPEVADEELVCEAVWL